jgi:hypothetical protein
MATRTGLGSVIGGGMNTDRIWQIIIIVVVVFLLVWAAGQLGIHF